MTSFKPVMMVSPQEFKSLVNFYKGNITESTLLDEAARVAAEARILIEDTKIDPALKEQQVKQMIRERSKAIKDLRQSAADVGSGNTATPADADSLQERVLKGVAKSINAKTSAAESNLTNLIQQTTPVSSGNKKRKQIQKKLSFTTTPGKRKAPPPPKKKKRKTELQRLQEDEGSWEPWEKRGWDPKQVYDDDDDDEDDDADGDSDDDKGPGNTSLFGYDDYEDI